MSYKDVVIQTGKPKNEYSVIERRAELLRAIIRGGHPHAVHQTQAAELYGVSQSQICQDIKAIKKEIVKELGSDAELLMEIVFKHAIDDAIKKGNSYTAAKAAKMWADWLFDMGAKTKASDKLELQGEVHTMPMPEILATIKETINESKKRRRRNE